MGSHLGRMLAITLPLAGIGIAAPFLAPALFPAAAGTAGAVGGATVGSTAGGVGAASAAPATVAAATPAVTAPTAGAAGGAAGGITPAMAAQGVQAGSSLASGLLNQSLNPAGQMPQMPTIRAPAQSAAPMYAGGLPSPAGAGLTANIPGPGATSYQGAGVAGDLGSQIANNLFSDQNPFAQYAMAA